MRRAVLVLLLLAFCAAVAAQKKEEEEEVPVFKVDDEKSVIGALKKEKLDAFVGLLDAAIVREDLVNENATVTVLAPTDEAAAAFLKQYSLGASDLPSYEPLSDSLAAYHIIVGANLGPDALFAKGDKAVVPTTADGGQKVTFAKTASGTTVTDALGNTAKVVKTVSDKKFTVYVIDKVLQSGSYFPSVPALAKALPSVFSSFAAAASKAGLDKALADPEFSDTLFVPTNAALKKAGIDLAKTSAEDVAALLKYHLVPGYHPIPAGFDSGKPIETASGANITVTYIIEKPIGKAKANFYRAVVRDSDREHATVIRPNLQAGKGIVHVIDAVLAPPKKGGSRRLLQDKPAAATTTTAKPATAKPAAAAETKPAAAAETKPAAAGATKPAAAAETKPAAAAETKPAAVAETKPAAAAETKPAAAAETKPAAAAETKPAAAAETKPAASAAAASAEVPAPDTLKGADQAVWLGLRSNGAFFSIKDAKGKKVEVQSVFYVSPKYNELATPDLAAAAAAAAGAAAKPAAAGRR